MLPPVREQANREIVFERGPDRRRIMRTDISGEEVVEVVECDAEECIQNCFESYRGCLEMTAYCLEQGGDFVASELVSSLQTCARMCQTTVEMLVSDSELYAAACEICAAACEQCADACDTVNDEQLAALAVVCRQCAETCREIV
jgi:hypothetical protein